MNSETEVNIEIIWEITLEALLKIECFEFKHKLERYI